MINCIYISVVTMNDEKMLEFHWDYFLLLNRIVDFFFFIQHCISQHSLCCGGGCLEKVVIQKQCI